MKPSRLHLSEDIHSHVPDLHLLPHEAPPVTAGEISPSQVLNDTDKLRVIAWQPLEAFFPYQCNFISTLVSGGFAIF